MRASFSCSIVVSLFFGLPLFAQSSVEQKSVGSLRKIFGDTISVIQRSIRLTQQEKDSLQRSTPARWLNDSIDVMLCRSGDKILGYGFIDNVKGKTQYITYLTAVLPNGEVLDIDVLVYRESYGGEIAYESFRRQFRRMTAKDKFQPGRDIKNISGATISVRAITAGVRKILLTFNLIRARLDR